MKNTTAQLELSRLLGFRLCQQELLQAMSQVPGAKIGKPKDIDGMGALGAKIGEKVGGKRA